MVGGWVLELRDRLTGLRVCAFRSSGEWKVGGAVNMDHDAFMETFELSLSARLG